MNKKAIAGFMFLVIAGLIFSFALFNLASKNKNKLGGENFIGEKQIALMNIYLEAEKDLLYMDKLGSYVLPNSLFYMAKSGGFYEKSGCGSYGNYNFWLGMKEDCAPNIYENLPLYLQDTILNYDITLHSNAKGYSSEAYIFSLEENQYGTSIVAHPYKPLIYEGMSSSFYMFTGEGIKYSVRPSFRAYENYYLDVYNRTYEKAKEVRDLCMNKIDYQKCVEDEFVHLSFEMPDYKWEHECDMGEEAVFYYFLGQVDACTTTRDDDCICKLDLSAKEGIEPGKYEITINSDGKVNMSNLEAKLDKVPIFYGQDPYAFSSYSSIKIILEYGENKNGVFLKRISMTPEGKETQGFSYISVYKDYIEDPIVQKENKFVFVEDDMGLPECRVFSRTAKVCVKSKETYRYYDGEKVVNAPIPIKFAMYFNDIFPPDPYEEKDIDVENKEKDEQSIIISFPEHEAEDIFDYKLYYSEKPFDKYDITTMGSLDLPAEIFNGEAILNLPDDGEFYFAVVPEDVFGNADYDNFAVVSGISEDNLAPGAVTMRPSGEEKLEKGVFSFVVKNKGDYVIAWDGPKLNSDGTRELVDLIGYLIYISKTPLSDGMPKYENIDDCSNDENCAVLDSDYPGETLAYLFPQLEPGMYYVIVSAFDENLNYLKKMEDDVLLMASSIFESGELTGDILTEIVMAEGGWVCDPDDTGGETYKGIAINFNDDWPYYNSFWSTVHDTIGEDDCMSNPIPSAQATYELNSKDEIQDYVRQFYEWYMEKHGILGIEDAPAKKLAFNFVVNTPVGTTRAIYYAKYGEYPSSKSTKISQELRDYLNSLDSINKKESFVLKFSEAMYDYYSKRNKKYRRGWFNRLKNGANSYLRGVGSSKKINIIEDENNEGVGKVVLV